MTVDNYDPAGSLSAYYPSRAGRVIARIWAREKTLHDLADFGAVQFFEGGGSDPTALPGYATGKLWLRVDEGVTEEAATVRYYAGGTASLLASWPELDREGFAAHLGAKSAGELDLVWSTAISGDPGTGKVRGNHATLASITSIAISKTGRQGQSYSARIALMDDDDIVRVYGAGDDSSYVDVRITGAPSDQTTYYTIPCAVRAATSLSDGHLVGLSHHPTATSIDTAQDWAEKIDGAVDGANGYSSKAWAIGGTGVTNTAARGSAKDWATNAEDSTVDGSGYSSLHYAAKASAARDAALAAQAAAISASTAAEAAQSGAEAARDAAFANADVYADIATGRAAVADGAQFMVASAAEIVRYRRDSGSTQTELARYPSVAGVEGARGFSASAEATLRGVGLNYAAPGSVSLGYLAIATGAFVSNPAYEVTDFIPVSKNDVLSIVVGVVPAAGGTSSVFFYDCGKRFLGAYRMLATSETVAISSHYTNAAYVRVVDNQVAIAGFTVRNIATLDPTRIGAIYRDVVDATIQKAIVGYISSANGDFISNLNFKTTPPIPAYSGQKYTVTANSNSLISTVSMWDSVGNWLGNAATGLANATEVTCTHASLAYVRFSAQVGSAWSAFGVLIGHPLEMPHGIKPPPTVNVTVGEQWPLFARSLYPDKRFPIAWDDPLSSERCYNYDAAVGGVDTIRMATVLEGGFRVNIAALTVQKFVKPSNPARFVNIVCLGDSTVQGTGAADGLGDYYDWPNELSWQITGTGRRCASDNSYFTTWGLSNVKFRGTRGAQAIKHEGRGGWSIRNYLDSAVVAGVPNAFWNSGAGAFDFGYYLTSNGFDDGSTADGVDATGSNLIVPIAMGWNDLETRTDAQIIADFGELIDAIRAARSATRFILLGHAPSPVDVPLHRSSFGGSRYLTARHIMSTYLVRLDDILASVATNKSVSHLKWQLQMDAETGFSMYSAIPVAPWQVGDTYKASADYVHPGRYGNMSWAHAIKGFLSQTGWLA